MSKAVRFDDYGGIEVLEVRDVARPEPGPDQVLVAVRAAGINPSEASMRAGLVRQIFPLTFPSGHSNELAHGIDALARSSPIPMATMPVSPSRRIHSWSRG